MSIRAADAASLIGKINSLCALHGWITGSSPLRSLGKAHSSYWGWHAKFQKFTKTSKGK